MNDSQIKALNTLYAATIEVMEAFAPEKVGSYQRREALARMLENFLISASFPDQGIVSQPIPQSDCLYKKTEDQSEEWINSKESVSYSGEVITSPLSESVFNDEENKRYALIPIAIDNDYCFKRLKYKEDRDENVTYPYIIILNGDRGVFEVEASLSDFNEEDLKRTFPERVIEKVQSGNADFPSKIVTVSRGELIKDGKSSWKVTKRAKVKYE